MTKYIFLITGNSNESYKDFETRMLTITKQVASEPSVDRAKITLTNEKPPTISIIPFKKGKIAVMSIFMEQKDKDVLSQLIKMADSIYLAEEALPVSYDIDWQPGEPTPGVCLLTFFRKKPDIDYSTFLNQWHNSHTPLSLKIHPLWNYNRNVVKPLEGEIIGAWDGIVEEQVKHRSELMNPFKFFGNPLVIFQRMWAVYTDTKKFLEYKTVSPYLATEYWIKM